MSREVLGFLPGITEVIRLFGSFSIWHDKSKVAPFSPIKAGIQLQQLYGTFVALSPSRTPYSSPIKMEGITDSPSPLALSPHKKRALTTPVKPQELTELTRVRTPSPLKAKNLAVAAPAQTAVKLALELLVEEKRDAFIGCLVRALDIANLDSGKLLEELNPKITPNFLTSRNAYPTQAILILLTYSYLLKFQMEELTNNTEDIRVNTPLQQKYKEKLLEEFRDYRQYLFVVNFFDGALEMGEWVTRFKDTENKIKEFAAVFASKQNVILAAFKQIPTENIWQILQEQLEIGAEDAKELTQDLLKMADFCLGSQVQTQPVVTPPPFAMPMPALPLAPPLDLTTTAVNSDRVIAASQQLPGNDPTAARKGEKPVKRKLVFDEKDDSNPQCKMGSAPNPSQSYISLGAS